MSANDVPPIQHNPPDWLTVIAAEFHEVFAMVAPQYGQSESGTPWKAMPRSYQMCLRHVLLTLLERETISRNYWRG